MRRVSLILLVVTFAVACASAQQSLGDAARRAQADKKAAPAKHVYTNDDIVTPTETAPAPEKAAGTDVATSGNPAGKAGADAKADAQKSDDKAKADKKDNKEEAAKASAELKQKIADQQKAVADQDHEISIMEREHQIKVAEYYADAGTQLRTSGQWFEDEKKYQEQLQAKKQALSDSKAKLDDLNDQARKAGTPGS
jgi:hypothetical protein